MNDMDDIYFKKVIARGAGKRESSIELTKGLNIICGPSNTGKTLIFKIFKQLFGADNEKYPNNDDEPFIIENDTGYTDFSLIISKNGDDVILTRKIDSETISVESNSPYVESGVFAYTNKKGFRPINDVLLKIFNVNPFKLPQKKDGTAVNFSLKFLDYLFLADEGRIDEGSQILLAKSKKYSSTTQSMANLLYLLYGMDFSNYLKDEDIDKLKLKRGAVRKYISDKITDNENEIKKLEKKLQEFSAIKDDSDSVQLELEKVRDEIDVKYKESANLEGVINTLTEKIESDEMLIERLESLSIQYKSDLERLNFIASGKDELDKNEDEHECPYCHSMIHEEKDQINLVEVQSEVNAAMRSLNDVSETLSEIYKEHEEEMNELKTHKDNLLEVRQTVSVLVSKRDRLEYTLKKFDEFIECQKRIEYLKNDNKLLKEDLSNMSVQIKVKKDDFIPTEHFHSSFFQTMTENIKGIMKFCGDTRYMSAEFDRASFDISIRGQSKSANNGKGFRSFVNSVTLLAFRKFLDEKGKHQLPVYVIDSPLKNLDVGNLEKENIKDMFFRYLLDASRSGQLIIIENTNNFTMTDELRENANIIEFTHDDNMGRYGFLLDYRD